MLGVGGEIYFRILLECLRCYVSWYRLQFTSTNDVKATVSCSWEAVLGVSGSCDLSPEPRDTCALAVKLVDSGHCVSFPSPFLPQYGNMTLPEDTAIGSTILVIQATDADEPFTGSSKILYKIVQGDAEGRLEVTTDPQTNTGYVKIKKVESSLNGFY